MAHIKAGSVTKGNRDSVAKRLGVKVFGGEKVTAGAILVRQRGTHFFPGDGVKIGSDDTLYAVKNGQVKFVARRGASYINIV